MASTYTVNNAIEKIGTGDQSGTWGTTTNTNLELIGEALGFGTEAITTNADTHDRAINGVGTITLSGATHALTTSDGAASDGHYKVLVFAGSISETNTVTIGPNTQDKLYFIKNGTGQSIIIKQGSGSTVTVTTGKTAIVYADGAGSGAAVASIEPSFTDDVTMKTSDGALLTLQTSEATVVADDVLGVLQFQAPDETGTDAIIVSASIAAVAEDTFAADNNKTKLSFRTGASEVAAEKMALDNGGDLKIVTDGKGINFGADSEITLTHVHNSGLTLTNTVNGTDDSPVALNLKSEEDAIVADDVIGKITFTAGDSDDSDAVAIAAAIEAVAEDTFAADNNATKLSFKTGASEAATEKMALSSAGVLSILADGSGTSSNSIVLGAGSDLQIFHDGSNSYINETGTGSLILKGSSVALQSSGGETMVNAATDGAVTLYYDNAIKLTTVTGGVTVNGTLTATTVTETSDERLKSDIKIIENGLDKVMNMRGVRFTRDNEPHIGVIAQEVEKIIPEVVTDGDYKSVAYGNMVGVLIEAVKDLKKELDEHKKGCTCGSNN